MSDYLTMAELENSTLKIFMRTRKSLKFLIIAK